MVDGLADWMARWRVPMGFLLGVAFLVFSQPTPRSLALGAAVALPGLLLRAYAAGCLDKNRSLARHGPYAYTRNPLYLGSFLMAWGFSVAGRSWILGGAVVGLFLLVYWPVMRREERHLRERFGEVYEQYAARVPLFFPNGRHAGGPRDAFDWKLYRKNREYEAAMGYVAVVTILALKYGLR
jgi:protein-S-isoprenylcysteine O-methyltransferase Ste14